ncbi:hypothetical protein GCM10027262_75210 [Nocardia tengchongensis]
MAKGSCLGPVRPGATRRSDQAICHQISTVVVTNRALVIASGNFPASKFTLMAPLYVKTLLRVRG